MPLRISVRNSTELQATILALKSMERTVAANIRRFTRQLIVPEWQRGLREHAHSRAQVRVLADTGRAAVSNQNITLKSATVGRSLAGGLSPKSSWAAFEFGADRGDARKTTYTATSRTGKRFSVTRNTRRQLPPRKRSGYVIYPTFADIVPRIAALWWQTTVRELHEALEKEVSSWHPASA